MSKHILRVFCLLLTVGIISCKKNVTEDSTPEKPETMSVGRMSGDYPQNKQGMLVFRNGEHFQSYLDLLEAAIRQNDDTSIDDHTVLQRIEDQLDFTSIRKISHDAFELQDAKGWPSLREIPDEHFIVSKDLRSVLNANLDVQVGDRIVHYINRDLIVSVDINQPSLVAEVQRLKGNGISIRDVITIDPSKEFVTVYNIPDDYFVGPDRPKPTGVDQIKRPVYKQPEGCANPKLLRFSWLALLSNGQYATSGHFKIFFGDGSSTAKNIDDVYYVSPFTHQYANFGTYTMTIKAYYSAGGPLKDSVSFSVVVANNTLCGTGIANSDWNYTAISSYQYIGGRLYLENLDPFLGIGSNGKRVVAESKLVKQNNDQSWSGYKGHLYTSLSCQAKDQDCAVVDNLYGDVADGNKKDHTLHRTGPTDFRWTTAYSTHVHRKDNTDHTVNISLNACP